MPMPGMWSDLWEKLVEEGIDVELGSDQTSLHNPFAGGYYPAGLSFDEANKMMVEDPEKFRIAVRESLQRQVAAINIMAGRGMYFWDYGNAFLLESGRAGADIFSARWQVTGILHMLRILWGHCFSIMDLDLSGGYVLQMIQEILS